MKTRFLSMQALRRISCLCEHEHTFCVYVSIETRKGPSGMANAIVTVMLVVLVTLMVVEGDVLSIR